MKLVIDIPEDWENIKFCDVVNREVIKNGISLEDIKAEIKSLESPFGIGEWYDAIAECIAVIDKHMERVSDNDT